MVKIWRIVEPHLVKHAFDGEGARRFGGRWNNKGTRMVYLAASLSLAAWEMVVHLPSDRLLQRYVCIPVEFSEECVVKLSSKKLPVDWQALPIPQSTRLIGDTWTGKQASLILEVPSVVVPQESNYLLNPAHPDIKQLRIGKEQSFAFDPRILKTR